MNFFECRSKKGKIKGRKSTELANVLMLDLSQQKSISQFNSHYTGI